MLSLRPYQRDAIDALYKYWEGGGGNGLIVLPTGSGKAYVLATIINELVRDYSDIRIACITHDKNLVAQNFKEFIDLSPFAAAGIYSAGLGRRDARAQILFGGIQSVAKRTKEIGEINLVLIDEAQAVSRNADTLYGEFFNGVLTNDPTSRRAGTTATDYRLDSGRLTDGEDRLFDDVVYEIGIGELIDQDFLAPLSSKRVDTTIDLSGVHKRGGEYIAGEMERAADQDHITVSAVNEAITRGHDRRAALFFCSGQDHSEHVRDEIRHQGRTAESLTSRVPLGEQRRILEEFKAGRVWALCSANMLTTGFNVPQVDLISMLRGTASTGLYVQMMGRGTRKAPGKVNCLVLDHSGNVSRHGPVDKVQPKTPGSGDGSPPMKQCPTDKTDKHGNCGCDELLLISVMKCTACGFEFEPSEEEKITARADDAPVLSTEKPWHKVQGLTFAEHPAKTEGKQPTVKASYRVGMKQVNAWICCQHEGYPKRKADLFWREHGGQTPFPRAVREFLERAGELKRPSEVQLDYSRNPRYPDVISQRFGEVPEADNDNRIEVEAANDNHSWADELDDAIPF